MAVQTDNIVDAKWMFFGLPELRRKERDTLIELEVTSGDKYMDLYHRELRKDLREIRKAILSLRELHKSKDLKDRTTGRFGGGY